jgi:hypothetical protein
LKFLLKFSFADLVPKLSRERALNKALLKRSSAEMARDIADSSA